MPLGQSEFLTPRAEDKKAESDGLGCEEDKEVKKDSSETIIAKIISGYRISTKKVLDNGIIIYNIAGDPSGSNACVTNDTTHKKPKTYLEHQPNNHKLMLKCRDLNCKHKLKVMYSKGNMDGISCMSKSLSVDPVDDDDLMSDSADVFSELSDSYIADKFVEIFGKYYLCKEIEEKRTLWWHNGFKWIADPHATKLREDLKVLKLIYLQETKDYYAKLDSQDEDEAKKNKKAMRQRIRAINNTFGRWSTSGNVTNFVKDRVTCGQDWNEDPNIFLFKNGKFNLNYTNESEAFGPSDPTELISDAYGCADYNYEEKIEQSKVEELETMASQICGDKKEEILTFLSLALWGQRVKVYGIFLGTHGNEGKTWLVNMTLKAVGSKKASYGSSSVDTTFLLNKGLYFYLFFIFQISQHLSQRFLNLLTFSEHF